MRYVPNGARPISLLNFMQCNCLRVQLQSQALMNAIKEYENNKWKVIGQKVGKPAKVRFSWRFQHIHPAQVAHRLTTLLTGLRTICQGALPRYEAIIPVAGKLQHWSA